MVDLVKKLLLFGFQLVQLDGQLAVLGQIDRRRMIERGERTVQRVNIAFGQAHHFPDVLQLVAQ